MRRWIGSTALAALALTLCVGTGSAATLRWGGQVFGGFNSYSMDDWNTVIDNANSTGTNYDNLKNGYSFGVGPTLIVNDQWEFGAHYEKLMVHKSSDPGTDISIELGANAFGVSGAYLFPSTGPMSFGVGVSVDQIQLTGTLKSPTMSADEDGSGIGFLFGGLGRYAFTPMASGELSVGYRVADIDLDKLGGASTTGSGLESDDYSGFAVRVGLSFHQPKK